MEKDQDVIPPSINLQEHSNVAEHARISPESHHEAAAEEAHSTQEYHHENEQPAAAEVQWQEIGDHQDDHFDDSTELIEVEEPEPEQELKENVVPPGLPPHLEKICQRILERGESIVRKEYLQPDQSKDENQLGPLHQDLDQADYSCHQVQSETTFHSSGKPGDDEEL